MVYYVCPNCSNRSDSYDESMRHYSQFTRVQGTVTAQAAAERATAAEEGDQPAVAVNEVQCASRFPSQPSLVSLAASPLPDDSTIRTVPRLPPTHVVLSSLSTLSIPPPHSSVGTSDPPCPFANTEPSNAELSPPFPPPFLIVLGLPSRYGRTGARRWMRRRSQPAAKGQG
ncbi:hypothetical protein BCR35DRAFT_350428 [Leucosporidium creatinivorum]|uniref:Uncharacterized protein n=1 Tax=Leucosporidium creatinivorum TaxID=106004 RepID=A0A1Y2G1N2_9BASI|nr:hypothetical protein BCR35DRAFT_350428 [Leucosporidium creatinivorum]